MVSQTLRLFARVTLVFIALSNAQEEIKDEWITPLERFAVLMYDRANNSKDVNNARMQLFTRNFRKFDAIPTTEEQKMLCSSMSNALPTKRAISGGKRSNHSKILNIVAGFLMTESGDPCGPNCRRSLSRAKSL